MYDAGEPDVERPGVPRAIKYPIPLMPDLLKPVHERFQTWPSVQVCLIMGRLDEPCDVCGLTRVGLTTDWLEPWELLGLDKCADFSVVLVVAASLYAFPVCPSQRMTAPANSVASEPFKNAHGFTGIAEARQEEVNDPGH
jgi:hypothetical protein